MKARINVLNVGHGDALLVRVERANGIWTMLVDGGRASAGVGHRVKQLIPTGDKPTIDLLVASHHDHDHLEGLVALMKSRDFNIREAWAPVVFHPQFQAVAAAPRMFTLTQELLEDDGVEGRVYAEIDAALDHFPLENIRDRFEAKGTSNRAEPRQSFSDTQERQDLGRDRWGRFPNLSAMVDFGNMMGIVPRCGELFPGVYDERFDPLISQPKVPLSLLRVEQGRYGIFRHAGLLPAELDYMKLMAIATAKAVFNVALTAEFIREARKQNIPVSMPLADLNGERWCDVPANKTLGPWVDHTLVGDLRIELLGPTKWLAHKLRSRLMMPAGSMRLVAALNSVTIPNRVSYVFNLHIGDAVALFTGDSGFSDFHVGGRGKFHDHRVERIGAAGWIKVPHHGGHFHRFGRAVRHLRDNLGGSTDGVFFVTSLGKGHRNPSLEFEKLARDLRRTKGAKPVFDFTNSPSPSRFDAVCAGCPRVGVSDPNGLEYSTISGGGWQRTSPKLGFCCDNYR